MKNILKISMVIYFSLLSVVSYSQSNFKSKMWKAGVSEIEITPKFPMWMAGYGFRDHPSEGKITDIWAKALALEGGSGKRSVLVTMDLVGIPKGVSDKIRDEIKKDLNLDRADIILNTAHNHSGPVLSGALTDIYPLESEDVQKIERYTKEFIPKVVKVIKDAFQNMEEVELYSSNGVARFQVNRRNNEEQNLLIQTHLNGPNDFAVPVIKIAKTNGDLKAIIFGYACHNTTLQLYKWSGDYAGYAQMEIEKRYPGVKALFVEGCGADQNPLPRGTISLAIKYGNDLADAVSEVLSGKMRKLSPVFQDSYKEIPLPLNPPMNQKDLNDIVKNRSGYQGRWARRMLGIWSKGGKFIKEYPYPVQVWNLGGQPIIILGGEVVVDYSVQLKYIFGEDLFVLGYSNDVMSYIPSRQILREGGYEGALAPMVYGLPATWRADAPTKIFNAVIDLAQKASIPIPSSKIE